MMKLIVAHGLNNEIGKGNRLLWDIPQDMRFFISTSKKFEVLICGRKTLESIPGKRLPGRTIIVLSKKGYSPYHDETIVNNISEIPAHIGEKIALVIGGESIYREFFNVCSEMFVTRVLNSYPDADSFFPQYKAHFSKKEVIVADECDGIGFSIERWVRIPT
jgi:dihydrofolate reductase